MGSFDELVSKNEDFAISRLEEKGFDIGISSDDSDQLQRTAQWFEDRKGSFTGSTNKDLMGCSLSTSKKPWGSPEKLIDFSKKAKKLVYEKAKERQTGTIVHLRDNINFKYGRKAEPIIVKKFIEQNKDITFEEKGFIKINDYLGASPDGNCLGIIRSKGVDYGFEAKAAMSWGTYYDRAEEDLDQKQMDFWQCQTEMLALKVKKLYYVTSEPVEDSILFIESEDEESESMIKGIAERVYDASEIHQKALMQRAAIGNNAINLYLGGMDFNEAMEKACTEFDINAEMKVEIEPKKEEIINNCPF